MAHKVAMASADESDWASKAGSNNILVVIRSRPMNEKEKKSCEDIVSMVEGKIVNVKDPGHFADNYMRKARMRDRNYAFDHAFDASATQYQVYAATTRFLIEGVLAGFNATVFAYGPTGSGKTHTMLGQRDNPGIMIFTLRDLYAQIGKAKLSGRNVTVSMSLIEVYNENIRDLLAADAEETDYLDLREDPVKGPCVAGVSEHDVESAEDVVDLLSEGNRRRTQEPTAANKESSRSHAVLQVIVQQREAFGQEIKIGKLSLIDLAGSERASNTQNRGIRLIEGANINRSLLALGNCITALVQGKGTFVPYRDSKLTRLLKDSLGGNTRTVMIGCISPSSAAFEETINTLKYCDRAKRIKINVSKNVMNVNYHISEYEGLIAGLRAEVSALKTRLSAIGVSSPSAPGSRPATASGISLTAAAVASHRGEFASALPLSSSLSSRQLAAINGPRPGTGGRRTMLAAAGSWMVGAGGALDSIDGALLEPTALDRLRELRQSLVNNFQERMQIRRSLAEVQAQNLENSVEVSKRQVSLARMEQASRLSSSSLNDADAATLKHEVMEFQHSIDANTRIKDDLLARLADNESTGEEIRLELDHYGTTEDRKELLALEYRVCLLELEKVELEQSQMLSQRAMAEKDMELKKLRLQVKARDNLIHNQATVLHQHNLSHLVDNSAIAAIDSEISLEDLEADLEHEIAQLSSPVVLSTSARAAGSIWDGYSGKLGGAKSVPALPNASLALLHAAKPGAVMGSGRGEGGKRRSLGSTSELGPTSPCPSPTISGKGSPVDRSDSRRASDGGVPVPASVPDRKRVVSRSPVVRESARASAATRNTSNPPAGRAVARSSLAGASSAYGAKPNAAGGAPTRFISERRLRLHALQESESRDDLHSEGPNSGRSIGKSPSRVAEPDNFGPRQAAGVRGRLTARELGPPPKAALSRLNGAIARGVKPAVLAGHDQDGKVGDDGHHRLPSVSPLRTPRDGEPKSPTMLGERRAQKAEEGPAIIPVGSLEALKTKVGRRGGGAAAASSSDHAAARNRLPEHEVVLEDVENSGSFEYTSMDTRPSMPARGKPVGRQNRGGHMRSESKGDEEGYAKGTARNRHF